MNRLTAPLAIVLAIFASLAHAELVTRVYSGSFSNTQKLGGDTDAASLFALGDTFVLTLTYDTDAARTSSSSTDAQYDGAGTVVVQYSNGYVADLVNQRIIVKNNGVLGATSTWDAFSISGAPYLGPSIGGSTLVAINFTLSEFSTGTVFTSTDLIPLPSVALFTGLRWIELVFQQAGATNYVRGTITGELTIPDSDDDGVPDATDNCSSIANSDQTDTDSDGSGDACDPDNDNDGVLDSADNCRFTVNPAQSDQDHDGIGDDCDSDRDGDGVLGYSDNCPQVPNADQTNTDGDTKGDDCDTDDDNDNVCDTDAETGSCSAGPDNCRTIVNADQRDMEGDGIGDACDSDLDNDGVENAADNCPVDTNLDQNDTDGDTSGDACDADIDNDNVTNVGDNCPYLANPDQADLDNDGLGNVCDFDADGDGVATHSDNCPTASNSSQFDFDGDGSGDACDVDVDGDQVADTSDQCALTPAGAVVDPDNGCSIPQLCPCSGPAGTTISWQNHGKYVSCVAHVAGDFAAEWLITSALKSEIVAAAAQSSCGVK